MSHSKRSIGVRREQGLRCAQRLETKTEQRFAREARVGSGKNAVQGQLRRGGQVG